MEKYIIAHDLGTTNNKAVLVTTDGRIVDSVRQTYPSGIVMPKAGYAEQVPDEWWNAVASTTKNLLQKTQIKSDDIAGMTFATQMQGFMPVTKEGKPLTNSYIWIDARGARLAKERLYKGLIKIKGYPPLKILNFLRITGGAPGITTGKDQIPKIYWLEENMPELYKNCYKFLDVKDYIIFKLTGKMVTSTDLAVVWWLLDTRKNSPHYNHWSQKLCNMAGIPMEKLAEVQSPNFIVGGLTEEAAKKTGLKQGTPIINGAGDMTCAAVGSGAILDGELHINLGTSGWIGGHVTKRKVDIAHYTGCVGSAYPEKYYLVMGHQELSAGAFEWLIREVLYPKEALWKQTDVEAGTPPYALFEEEASKIPPGSDGLIFTPWLFGERCPLDDYAVRGGLHNLSLDHSRGHIIRAVYEGIALNLKWALFTVENLYSKVDELRIIGGGATNDLWCQIIADVMDRKIQRVEDVQTAVARGAAMLGSFALGYIKNFEDIGKYIKVERTFSPDSRNRAVYNELFGKFKEIYKLNKKWYKALNG